MSGLWKKTPMAEQDSRIGAFKVSTSMQGRAIPKGYGRRRVPGHLVNYVDFKAHQQEERSEAGKGGSAPPSRMYWVYSATVQMVLGWGAVPRVDAVWRGKEKFSNKGVTLEFVTYDKVVQLQVPSAAPYQVTVPLAAGETLYQPISVQRIVQTTDATDMVPDPFVAMSDPESFQTAVVTFTGSGLATLASHYAGRLVRFKVRIQTDAISHPATTALQQLNLGLIEGELSQGYWSQLSSRHPEKALSYRGMAQIVGLNYALDSYAQVPNHNFEANFELQGGGAAYPDCNPRDVARDVLLDTRYGAAMPGYLVGTMDRFSAFCAAAGIFVSPYYDRQRPVREVITELAEAACSIPMFNGNEISILPLSTETLPGYAPNTEPVMDLSEDDFVARKGRPLVAVDRSGESKVPSRVVVQYTNRAMDYADDVADDVDHATEIEFGRSVEESIVLDMICRGDVARRVAAVRRQLARAKAVEFDFDLPLAYYELEPGDLVTLTDAVSGLDREPVLIHTILEQERTLRFRAWSFPLGTADPPVIDPPPADGFIPNTNADPGNALAPFLLEPPGNKVKTGLELWIGASGGADWGGCDVYASLDGGSSYRQVATVDQPARYGTTVDGLGANTTDTVTVDIVGRFTRLPSISEAEEASERTLLYIGTPEEGEYLTYRTAVLKAPGRYQLSGLRRGLYGTRVASHSAGARWALVDLALAPSEPLDHSLIGKTIFIKLVSVNPYGGGLQSLADVPAYPYTVTGRFADLRGLPVTPNLIVNADFSYNTSGWTWSGTIGTEVDFFIDPVNRMSGVPSNATLKLLGGIGTAFAPAMTLRSKIMTVDHLKDLISMIRLLPVGCDVQPSLRLLNSNTAAAAVTQITSAGAIRARSDSEDPADYVEARWRTDPKSDSRYGWLELYAFNLTPDALVRVHKPMVGEVVAGENGYPPWVMGLPPLIEDSQMGDGSRPYTRVVRLSQPYDITNPASAGFTIQQGDVQAFAAGSEVECVVAAEVEVQADATGGDINLAFGVLINGVQPSVIPQTNPVRFSAGATRTLYMNGTFKLGQSRKGNNDCRLGISAVGPYSRAIVKGAEMTIRFTP